MEYLSFHIDYLVLVLMIMLDSKDQHLQVNKYIELSSLDNNVN